MEEIQRVFDGLFKKPVEIPSFSVNALPDPAAYYSSVTGKRRSALIHIYDESGGDVVAWTNGSNWLRATDRAIAS